MNLRQIALDELKKEAGSQFDPAVVRALYAVASAAWVEAGRTNHHVLVPATVAVLLAMLFKGQPEGDVQ